VPRQIQQENGRKHWHHELQKGIDWVQIVSGDSMSSYRFVMDRMNSPIKVSRVEKPMDKIEDGFKNGIVDTKMDNG
jgi:hypothetical protein